MKGKQGKNSAKTSDGDYSVVRFEDNGSKLFECIWDGWFVDENRNSCFWPPSKGKSYLLRVLSKEPPEDSWKVHQCTVVSSGHVTYKNGFDLVKRKCQQKYNTSSADEQQATIDFRRKHPVLSTEPESFENLFNKKKETAAKPKLKKNAKENRNKKVKAKNAAEEPKTALDVPTGQSQKPSRPASSSSLYSKRDHQSSIGDLDETCSLASSSYLHRSRQGSHSPISNRSESPRSRSRSSIRDSRSTSRDSKEQSESAERALQTRSRSRSNTPNLLPQREHDSPKSTPANFHFVQLLLKELRIIVRHNDHRISVMERRLGRMEVAINKVLVTVTDLKQAINSKGSLESTAPQPKSNEPPKGTKEPDFPIKTLVELIKLKRNLRDGEFRTFLLTQEAYYCSASRQSNSVVMTAYLKRFMTLGLRDTLHLKDSKGKDDNPILMRDFPEIYKFLIDVMVKGYAMSNTPLKSSETHLALRTVWGRTKQMMREQGL